MPSKLTGKQAAAVYVSRKDHALWRPMLAAKPDPEEMDATLAKLSYPALWSPKLDGIRTTVQNGKLYSRSLKLIPNLEMQKLWGRKELNGLDGEIIVGSPTAEDCFNRTTSIAMSRDKAAEGAVFHVFDKYFVDRGFDDRLSFAVDDPNHRVSGVQFVDHVFVKNAAALAKYEDRQLKLGYEGVMRRSIDGRYKQGRSTIKEGGLIAVKRFVDAEAVVLGTYEQQKNTNQQAVNELGRMKRSSHKAGKVGKGTLGGFTVCMINDARCSFNLTNVSKDKQFNIGTGVGLTDAVRAELWAKRKSLVGKIVKFRYQLVGTRDAPRLPVFLGFRDGMDL
jgi:DNA ligase-1